MRRLEGALAHLRGDLLVRVAERHALADERLGGVGREQSGSDAAFASRSASNSRPSTSTLRPRSAP